MCKERRAGEKFFVDYAGMTVPVYDRESAKMYDAQIFVAALGRLQLFLCQGHLDPEPAGLDYLPCSRFCFFGGVSQIVTSDNLKTDITKACYYEPDINPTYLEMANHYGMVILPAWVHKPKDKAKVGSSVQVVERWILARLRNCPTAASPCSRNWIGRP